MIANPTRRGAATVATYANVQENEFSDRGRRKAMYKSILIPTDGSELAGKAVQHGIAFAKEIGAKITVLTVTVPFRHSLLGSRSRHCYAIKSLLVPSQNTKNLTVFVEV
jgi:Universal stress protein family